jgi:hypothetical protein
MVILRWIAGDEGDDVGCVLPLSSSSSWSAEWKRARSVMIENQLKDTDETSNVYVNACCMDG